MIVRTAMTRKYRTATAVSGRARDLTSAQVNAGVTGTFRSSRSSVDVTTARSATYVAAVSTVIARASSEAQMPVAFSVGAPRSVGESCRAA
jgi:hypothetical protein